jgi:hypothetical protein
MELRLSLLACVVVLGCRGGGIALGEVVMLGSRVPDYLHLCAVSIESGERQCKGVLVDPEWILSTPWLAPVSSAIPAVDACRVSDGAFCVRSPRVSVRQGQRLQLRGTQQRRATVTAS